MYQYCNCEIKLLKLKANYNCGEYGPWSLRHCNCEIKLLKLKANYNVVLDKVYR